MLLNILHYSRLEYGMRNMEHGMECGAGWMASDGWTVVVRVVPVEMDRIGLDERFGVWVLFATFFDSGRLGRREIMNGFYDMLLDIMVLKLEIGCFWIRVMKWKLSKGLN